MTVAEAIRQGSERLASTGIENPRGEASLMLTHVTGRGRTALIAHPEHVLPHDELSDFELKIKRRAAHEPFHYITGEKEFYGLDFIVAPGVLIPRPETELLVEEALGRMAAIERPRIFEIGVGSGCISIALLANNPELVAAGSDISAAALAIADKNAERHGVTERLLLRHGDAFEGVTGRFDLIVSNPPYIPESDRYTLASDVVDFEPHSALFSGRDGLDLIRRIALGAPDHLNPYGSLIMEIGAGQADALRTIFAGAGWHTVSFLRDLQGIERIVTATLTK